MRCPTCGHENSDLATRCAACGSMLPTTAENTSDATIPVVAGDDATLPQVAAVSLSPDGTAEHMPPPPEAPAPTVDNEPRLREVAGTAGKFASAKKRQLGMFFSTHQRALGICLALAVVVVLGVLWLVVNLFDAPTYTKIEEDIAAKLPSFEYVGGTYGPDLTIPLSNVGVTGRSSTRTPEGLEVAAAVGPTAFSVEAEATFDDGKIRVVRDVGATYVRSDGEWNVAGELAERGTSFTARAGVDEGKVLSNVGAILDATSSNTDLPLADIYTDGDFSIVGNVFKEAANKDTATNDVTISCNKANGFYSYQGNVTAHFAFESGSWVLRSAEADANASKRTYAPIVGTWTGSLVNTSSNGVGNCYGAQDHEIVIDIQSVGDASSGGGQVQGTITVLAHYHKQLDKKQASCKGDTMVDQLAFTGTIRASHDESSADTLVATCTTTGSPIGDLAFTIAFGTDEDPSAVTAQVTSSHIYEETVLMFIPRQTTAEFTDTYVLSRV